MNQKRRKPSSIWRIIVLGLLVAGAIYINQVVVPTTPPLFIPTATPTRSPESFITEAENLLAQGKMSLAIQAYQRAIEANPKDPSNYIIKARLLVFTGDYQDATTMAEDAILLAPGNAMAHAVRGWARGFLGDYVEANASLQRALELDPNNAIAYAYYSELLVLQNNSDVGTLGSMDKAIEYSKKAMELNPNLLETHRARGIVLEVTGNYQEAIKEFQAAIALNDNIADLHLALGRNYRYIEDYVKAVDEFNRASALNPTDPLPLLYISRAYAALGEYSKAIQYAQQAVKNSPKDPSLYGNLGSMLYRKQQYADAIAALRLCVYGGTADNGEKIESLPIAYGRPAEYYYIYGLALARTGECGEAIQISRQVSQAVPNDDVAVYNAGEMINICKQIGTGTPQAGGTTTPPSAAAKTATARSVIIQRTATPQK